MGANLTDPPVDRRPGGPSPRGRQYLPPMQLPNPISWTPEGRIRLLDQTLLPSEERYLVLDSVESVAEAIRTLRVRGAPLIGIAAAMGVALVPSADSPRW